MRFSGAWIAAAAALVIAVSSAVLIVQEHAGVAPHGAAVLVPSNFANQPGLDEGRVALGLDCGVIGASTCFVEQVVPPGLMAGN